MKKITAVLMIMAIMMTSMAMPEAFVSEFADEAITATAATDAWGREYLTYGDLRYQVQSDNTICIIGFDISKDTVEIPDEIDGMPVTKIGAYAFCHCPNLDTVRIPTTIKTMGDYAFSVSNNYTNISNVAINFTYEMFISWRVYKINVSTAFPNIYGFFHYICISVVLPWN